MNQGAPVESAVQALAAGTTAISRTLLDDANNRGEAKAWLISTLAEQQQQHSTHASCMACFDPCSLPAGSPDSWHGMNDSYNSSDDRRDGSSSRQGSRRAPTQQQQGPSPIASCKPAALQLLQLLCDAQPAAVAQLLSRDPRFLCSCLTASAATTAAWFGQFSLAGIQHFKHGARALANYALTHRNDVWQYLVWAGKHDQAPVAVAGKPHYFAELDIDRTMLGLSRHCHDFWASEELERCCQSGKWLQLEPDLVLQELHRLLHEPRSSRHAPLRQLISSFLVAADWTLLCNRLLPLLPEQQLLTFARLVAQHQQQQQRQAVQGSAGLQSRQRQQQLGSVWHWLDVQARYNESAAKTARPAAAAAAGQLPCVQHLSDVVLCPSVQQWALDQLLLVNALTCRRQQLLSLLQQEDEAEQLLQLVKAAEQLFGQQQQQAAQQVTAVDSAEASREQQGAAAAAAVQQLVNAVSASAKDWPGQQLQLLVVGWLLRLQLLLAAAGGPPEADRVLRGFGCSCNMAQRQQQATVSQAQQQQQQQAAAELDNQAGPEQVEQPAKQPLRRGSAAAAATDQGHGEQEQRSRKRKKERSSKHNCRQKAQQRRSRREDSSDSSHEDSDDSAVVRRAQKLRRRSSKQHSKKKRRHAHSSSSDSGSSSSSMGSMDLDAGGELLDPAAFPPWTHAAAAAAPEGTGGAVTAAARAPQRSRAGRDNAGAGAAADEKQDRLAVVLEALSGPVAGRRMTQHGLWMVQLRTSNLAAAAAGGGDGGSSCEAARCVAVTGMAAEVLDAAAWYCTWLLAREAVAAK